MKQNSFFTGRWLIIPIIVTVISCSSEDASFIEAEIIEVQEFETVLSYKNGQIANPSLIKYDGEINFFIYDSNLEKVMEISDDGSILNVFGRRGNGPGEFQTVADLYLTENYLYIVDDRRFLIHKYHRNGELDSSMDYGAFGTHRINNPVIMKEDSVLIPSPTTDQAIYQLVEWRGSKVSELGRIPEGSTDELNYDNYRTSVSNRTVPAYFQTHAFTVNNNENADELFVIYEAYPKIDKYKTSGELLWETEPIQIPEIDSIAIEYYDFMDMVLRQANAITHLRKYVAGVSNNGNLYLSTDTNRDRPLWIHEFDSTGNLTGRYHIQSDVELSSQFDIDFENKRIFVLTEEAEVRAYTLN